MKSERKQLKQNSHESIESDSSDEAVNDNQSPKGYQIQHVNPTKSDDQILRIYEKLMGETPQEKPSSVGKMLFSPKVISSTQNTGDSTRAEQSPMKITHDLVHPLQRIQELPSREAEAASTRAKRVNSREMLEDKKPDIREMDNKNSANNPKRKTNYSVQYEQGKPFKNKPHSTKKTIDDSRQEQINSDKQPSRSTQNGKKTTNTAQNFKKKLQSNTVTDKEQHVSTADRKAVRPSHKPQSTGKLPDERKIREDLMELNYEQTVLQAELRKIHMENKDRHTHFYKQHNIRNNITNVIDLTGDDILVLDEPQQQSIPQHKNLPKKLKWLNDDNDYIQQINLQLRKVNHLLKIKIEAINQLETRIGNNPLNAFIEEALNRDEQSVNDLDKSESEMIYGKQSEQLLKGKENEQLQKDQTEFSTYKEVMKYRKNKTWVRNQRINFGQGKTVKDSHLQLPQDDRKEVAPDRIETYEIDGVGKLKVNTNLKNLLFN